MENEFEEKPKLHGVEWMHPSNIIQEIKTMKVHIPTTQYGFVEVEVFGVSAAREVHDEVMSAFSTGSGLPEREFNECLDEYLIKGTGKTESFLAMNREQQGIIQALKRAYKRIGTLDA